MSTEEVFLAPLIDAMHDWNRSLREGEQGLRDEDFLKLGVHRILRNNESGRDFFQHAKSEHDLSLSRSGFFDAFRSSRRLEVLKDTAAGLYRDASRLLQRDLLENFPQLNGLDVIAGDGHLLAAACHAERDAKGCKVAANSLFMLNVRNGLMLPLAGVQGDGRHAHEMPVLREHLPAFLQRHHPRAHALQKVVMLLDPAFVDTVFWSNFEEARNAGARMVMPEKSKLRVYPYEDLEFDRDDPVNTGVVSYETVGFAAFRSAAMHRVVYRDPETGRVYRFLTTVSDLAPGLIALLYLLRWRIEKVFDIFKNKLHETKAWGSGPISQQIQAQFVCMTQNLIVLFCEKLKERFQIEPIKLYEKRDKALETRSEQARGKGRSINPLLQLIRLPSQFSCQLIRALRNGIRSGKRFLDHIPRFRIAMEAYF